MAVVWFALYDFQYLGAPPWFKENFETLGVHDYAETPKRSHVAFQKMKAHPLGGTTSPVLDLPHLVASPNPCDDACTVRFANVSPREGHLHVYDLAGRLVTRLPVNAGCISVRWAASAAPAGAYLIRSTSKEDGAHALITVVH